ncbi:MAG TPA: GNAT family N-acetyltransferase [Planctomycetaceae bacterium]|nr:GNAT family N-acetyltransferase [Planctomycetaceae bacterium]
MNRDDSVHPHVPGLMIAPVEVRDWPAALAILFATFPVDEQQPRIDSTLVSVSEGRLNLSGLRWGLENGEPVAASLTMEQPDGITLVWPPVVTTAASDPIAVEAALMREVTARLDASSARLGQILLDPAETPDSSVYQAHGFTAITNLDFLVRELSDDLPAATDEADWTAEAFDASRNADRFAALLEASYTGSLDCTVLEGLRNGREALASHRLSGEFRPELWILYRAGETDVAVVLLNEHPEQSAVELVYFGVLPSARGRGYGRKALIHALNVAKQHGGRLVFLAVDSKNSFAIEIYGQLGFSHLSRRQALFRWPGGLA